MNIKTFLVLLLILNITISQKICSLYLAKLFQYLLTDHQKFQNQIAPYLLFSGKGIDDLGYPGSCEKDQNNYMYSTVEISFVEESQKFYGYMGFCFVKYCSADQLNNNADFIINYILEDYHTPIKSTFVDPELQIKFSVSAFIFCMLFCIPIAVGMIAPIKKWIKQCRRSESQQYIIKSTYIDLQNPNNQLDEEAIDENTPLIQRLSLQYKWKKLMQPELSNKIYGFSLLRIIAIPILIYCQIFAESNKAAFNYISYADSVYGQFFSKLALFGYYIPDLFFMISAYLLTDKLLRAKISEETPFEVLMRCISKKFTRLYPIYISILIIYWCISPGLHCGPVWYAYQEQVSQCNSSWWRVILLIDNWFKNNTCYEILWFVQCQIQYTFCAVFLFTFYYGCKKVAYGIFSALYLTFFVLLFVLSAEMVVTLDIALSAETHSYFRSFYSHFLFYLTGMLIAFLLYVDKSKKIISVNFIQNKIVRHLLNLVYIALSILILLRPSLWSQSQHSLSVELALCRIAMLLAFSHLCIQCILQSQTPEKKLTSIHKYAHYAYPIILISSLVIQGSYWSVSSFMYISGSDLLNATIGFIFVCVPVGIFIGLIIDVKA